MHHCGDHLSKPHLKLRFQDETLLPSPPPWSGLEGEWAEVAASRHRVGMPQMLTPPPIPTPTPRSCLAPGLASSTLRTGHHSTGLL
jgi:hypothetical protein